MGVESDASGMNSLNVLNLKKYFVDFFLQILSTLAVDHSRHYCVVDDDCAA